jgi:acyl-CoA synthetase (AMP-forming)/AMP-acid ligase II
MSSFDSKETTTLWQRWNLNSERIPDKDAIVHWNAGEEPIRWTFKKLTNTAKKYSTFIKSAGIKPGEVCAIIIRHNPFFYPLYLGVSRAAALPAVLAYPNTRLHPDKFRSGIEGMSQRSGLDYILTERELEPIIRPLTEKPGSTIKALLFPLEWDLKKEIDTNINEEIEIAANKVKGSDPVLLQHSSGTTGLQKPVILSHSAVLKHIAGLENALNLSTQDKIASWLPLYHDMGLIAAFHLPLSYGITSIQIDPFQWVVAPIIQLEAISLEKATLCWLPNFAYNIFADKIDEDELNEISLASLRLTINCSEPVRSESHKKFIARFAKYNFNPLAISACYGMAETTFAITQTTPGSTITELKVDRTKLAQGFVEITGEGINARTCVSSGKLINECRIRIVDDNRNDLPGDRVGEIAVKSISMFDGYRNYPEKTAEVVHDGWYFTGDYGFIHNNEYFIIGRKKDLIIVAGKNIYPEDVESAMNLVDGVIPGRVIAFGEEDEQIGTEQIAVVAETKAEDDKERNNIRLAVIKAGMSIDVNIHKVYLVPPRWLIKSSAGKPSRTTNKERIISRQDKLVWSR